LACAFPLEIVELCAELFARGAAEVGVADTIGVATPVNVTAMCALAAASVPIDRLSLHVHDTRGLGVANVIAAFDAGVRRFDGSVGGVGGCPFAPRSTGNVCTEDLVHMLHAMGIRTGIQLDRLLATSQWIEGVIGRTLPGQVAKAGLAFPELAA